MSKKLTVKFKVQEGTSDKFEEIATAAAERVDRCEDVDVAEVGPFIEQHYVEVDLS